MEDTKPFSNKTWLPLSELPAASPERSAAVDTILSVVEEGHSALDDLTSLVKQLLKVDSVCTTVIAPDTVFIQQSEGFFSPRTVCVGPALCHWALVPEQPGVLVIEDTSTDARTSEMDLIRNPPHVGFYAHAPLVTSSRQTIGTLCLMHKSPLSFKEDQVAVLINFAELIMRHLEGRVLEVAPASPVLQGTSERGVAAWKSTYAILDTSVEGWRIQLGNPKFLKIAGIKGKRSDSRLFWELFSRSSPKQSRCKEDEQLVFAHETPLYSVQGFPGTILATMRPLASNRIDEHSLQLSIPARELFADAVIPAPQTDFSTLFFVHLRPAQKARRDPAPPFPDLRLGPALGAGAYASVYRGALAGEKIAVKIVHTLDGFINSKGEPCEAVKMRATQHPNIVRLLNWRLIEGSLPRLWLLLEYCAGGRLSDGIDKGLFRTSPSPSSGPCTRTILAIAVDILNALAYLHDSGILHCDLGTDNVLLTPSAAHDCGFSAKISDFGLSRWHTSQSVPVLAGTPRYLPPESLRGDAPTKAADVYAFGVILLEMVSGARVLAGLEFCQIYHEHIILGNRLEIPSQTPPEIRGVIAECLRPAPEDRPTAVALLSQLEACSAAQSETAGLDRNGSVLDSDEVSG